MALQLSPGQQPVEHAAKLDQSIKINTYLCQPLFKKPLRKAWFVTGEIGDRHGLGNLSICWCGSIALRHVHGRHGKHIGKSKKIRESANRRRETRDLHFPIVRFINGNLTEIEFFYDVESLHLEDLRLFSDPGLAVMRRLEQINGGAEEAVGIVLFRNLGITTGRLDEDVRGEHSVTAFSKGLWDDDTSFKPISF